MNLKFVFVFFLFVVLLTPRIIHAGYVSDVCPGTAPCPDYVKDDKGVVIAGVGPFMKGISNTCGNTGKCELKDLMIVVENVGNFVLSIIGSLLLAFYIYGGTCYLVSHGDQDLVNKGKKIIKTATLGFLFVMVAYIGINSIKAFFVGSNASDKPGETTYTCSGKETDGKSCGPNQICNGTDCSSKCDINFSKNYVCGGTPADPAKAAECKTGLCADDAALCCPK